MKFDVGVRTGPNVERAAADRVGGMDQSRDAQASDGSATSMRANHAEEIPATPPEEVLDAMGVAAWVYDELAARGEYLSFEVDDATGRVTATMHATDDRIMFTVPASQVLEIASGATSTPVPRGFR